MNECIRLSEMISCKVMVDGIPACLLVSDKVDMPDTLGHSVGPERWELLARLAGNEVGCVLCSWMLS